MKKACIMLGFIFLISLPLSIILIKLSKTGSEEVIMLQDGKWILDLKEGELDPRKDGELIVKEYNDILRIIHKMSNTMIVPDDNIIDGTIEITQVNLQTLHLSAYKYFLDTYGTEDSYFKSDVYKIIKMWQEGDFTYCVDIHNFCTQLLGINEGEAIELDYNNEY